MIVILLYLKLIISLCWTRASDVCCCSTWWHSRSMLLLFDVKLERLELLIFLFSLPCPIMRHSLLIDVISFTKVIKHSAMPCLLSKKVKRCLYDCMTLLIIHTQKLTLGYWSHFVHISGCAICVLICKILLSFHPTLKCVITLPRDSHTRTHQFNSLIPDKPGLASCLLGPMNGRQKTNKS